MDHSNSASVSKRTLPIILFTALLQGWALYGLHFSVTHRYWPATHAEWLITLYAVVLFTPLTLHLLVDYVRSRTLWIGLASIAVTFGYFGWHHGAVVYDGDVAFFLHGERFFYIAFVMLVLWLQVMPFLQGRVAAGHWRYGYPMLFVTAWRNKLMLAEAVLFTGLFWLLLLLWGQLFLMLGMGFFKKLFEKPIFFYPVTSLAFGIALYLIGSIERMTLLILEQLLNVLKWLLVVAGIILAIFTVALAFKLPALVFTGQRAIGAVWLLWLVAVVVLLINAAYRDGLVAQPYPQWIARAFRYVIPLIAVISLTAIYALAVRTHQYGVTVERVWAFIVAGSALLHSVGYAFAAVSKGPWMHGVARVNVMAALALIVAMAAALTPLLSPYRLAANSQFELAKVRPLTDKERTNAYSSTPLSYLRFDSGSYGREKLRLLSELQGEDSAQIRKDAAAAIAKQQRWEVRKLDTADFLQKLTIYPAGRELEAALQAKIRADAADKTNDRLLRSAVDQKTIGIFADLNGDGSEEFILLWQYGGLLYERSKQGWLLSGTPIEHIGGSWEQVLKDMEEGKVSVMRPRWNELNIGKQSYGFRALTKQDTNKPNTSLRVQQED